MRLLIVADELSLVEFIESILTPEFVLDVETTPSYGIYSAQTDFYSLIIIDNNLSSMRGSQVCKLIREKGVCLPILTLNNGSGPAGRVSCLELGADDCLERPFAPEELRARVRVLLRRFSPSIPKDNRYKIQNVEIDFWNRVIIVDEEEIFLRRKEFDLLELFIVNRNRVLTKNYIFCALWKEEYVLNSNIVAVYVCYLRRTLQKIFDKELIRTIYGFGYVFDDSELQKIG